MIGSGPTGRGYPTGRGQTIPNPIYYTEVSATVAAALVLGVAIALVALVVQL
jgi:hypothetical protein